MRLAPGWRIVLAAVLGGALVALLATAVLLLDGLTDERALADVAVVLGNTVRPDGSPSPRLRARGVPDAAIVVDSQGWTTRHSARNAAAWMRECGATRAYVVTQHVHVARSKVALRPCGVATVHGAHARYFETRDLYSTAREVVGFVAYRLRGCSSDPADGSTDG